MTREARTSEAKITHVSRVGKDRPESNARAIVIAVRRNRPPTTDSAISSLREIAWLTRLRDSASRSWTSGEVSGARVNGPFISGSVRVREARVHDRPAGESLESPSLWPARRQPP